MKRRRSSGRVVGRNLRDDEACLRALEDADNVCTIVRGDILAGTINETMDEIPKLLREVEKGNRTGREPSPHSKSAGTQRHPFLNPFRESAPVMFPDSKSTLEAMQGN